MATSLTARRQSADPLERFDTPAWMTKALLLKLPRVGKGGVLEPMAGNGAIVEVLRQAKRRVRAFDLEPRVLEMPLFGVVRDVKAAIADATEPGFWRGERTAGLRWCVTNPAFSLATTVRNLARAHGFRLAMLLRGSALEPTEDRAPWLVADPPSELVLLPRGSFIPGGGPDAGGTDLAAAFWFVWSAPEPRPGRATRLLALTIEERGALIRPGQRRRARS